MAARAKAVRKDKRKKIKNINKGSLSRKNKRTARKTVRKQKRTRIKKIKTQVRTARKAYRAGKKVLRKGMKLKSSAGINRGATSRVNEAGSKRKAMKKYKSQWKKSIKNARSGPAKNKRAYSTKRHLKIYKTQRKYKNKNR